MLTDKELSRVYFRQGYADGVRWMGKACSPDYTIFEEMLAEPETFCKFTTSDKGWGAQGFLSAMVAVTYGVNLLPQEGA